MSNFKSIVLLTFGAVASVGAVGLASADARLEAPKMVVHFNPQDLNSEAGIKKVYLQIRSAAESVCPSITTGTYLTSSHALECRKAAIAGAVEAIHNKRLVEIASASKFA